MLGDLCFHIIYLELKAFHIGGYFRASLVLFQVGDAVNGGHGFDANIELIKCIFEEKLYIFFTFMFFLMIIKS